MVQNPNWPLLDFAVSWAAGPMQSPQQPLWCSVKERTETQFTGQRGKQYELDEVQPGTYKVTLRNDDGVFDPDNTASPFAGYVVPYRLFRARAQYPPTPNLLTADQATGGRAEAVLGTGAALPADVAAWGGAAVSVFNLSSTLNEYLVQYPASPTLFTGVGFTGWSVVPGQTYSASGVVMSSASTGQAMYFAIQWFAADGVTVLSVSNGSSTTLTTGLQTMSLTATAPANAAGARLLWLNSNSPATAVTVGLRTLQLEMAAAPTAYQQPGHWYPIFTGYVERWPQTWASQGNYGTVACTVVDYFSNLANHGLLAPFKADLMALNPNFLYPLDEAAGATTFADLTGKRGSAFIRNAAVLNTVLPGASIASGDNSPQGPDAATAITGAFLGGAGPVMASAQPANAQALAPNNGASIQIPPNPATGLVGVPQTGGFTRLIAFRATGINQIGTCFAIYDTDPATGFHYNQLYMNLASSSMLMGVGIGNINGQPGFALPNLGPLGSTAGSGTVTDTDWHLGGVALSADGQTVTVYADNGPPVAYNLGGNFRPAAGTTATMGDAIGSISYPGVVGEQWIGDLAYFTEIPAVLTPAQWSNLAQSWRNAWSTIPGNVESSDERYQRILNWINYTGPTRLSPGLCKSVGPANDIATSPGTPALALTALENVVETEGGEHFIGADGAIVFQSRADRYNKTPVVTFGEHDLAGEYPYKSAATDYDPTMLANDIQITAQYGNVLYREQDGPSSNPATSQGTFGVVTFARTVNSVDPNELTSAAQFYLAQRKEPATRLQALPFDVGANPALWPVLLGLELGECVAWNRRPSNAPANSLTGFVEQIAWTIDDQLKATCTVQVSNTQGRNGLGQYGTKRYAPDPGSVKPSAAMNAVQTTVTLVTTGGTPATNQAGAFPFDIIIDSEQITLTAPSGSTTSPQTFTILRGVNGTTAATHAATASVSIAAPNRYAY